MEIVRIAAWYNYVLLETKEKCMIYKDGEKMDNLAGAVREVRTLVKGFNSTSPNNDTLVRQMIIFINTGENGK